MKAKPSITGWRAIREIETGKIVTDFSSIYTHDWPYQDVAPGQPLLRYMDLFKLEDLLKTQSLYFCRADKFKDPLEGTLSLPWIHGTSDSDLAFKEVRHGKEENYSELLKYREIAKAGTFISCWHMNTNESQQMWNAYTTSSESAVVITFAERLAAALKVRVVGSPVKYVTKNIPRTEFDVRSLFFYKDQEFGFENEFRLLADIPMLGDTVRPDYSEDFYRRIPVDLSTLVYGIQPHPNASDGTKNKIQEWLREFLPDMIAKAG